MEFSSVEVSEHAAKRYLMRKHNKLPPFTLDDKEMACSELEARFLSGKWRIATGEERRKYYRKPLDDNQYVASTEDGCFLVAYETDKLVLITFIDEYSNVILDIHSNLPRGAKSRRGRRGK